MKTMTRKEAVAALRQRCVELTDDEHSVCAVAARLHILCGGFSQYTFGELRERYDWIVKTRGKRTTRQELEDLANRWQLARQEVNDEELSCDNQRTERHHPTCKGWDTHSDKDLARFVEELYGEPVRVVAESGAA
jgi:hypothetical protein